MVNFLNQKPLQPSVKMSSLSTHRTPSRRHLGSLKASESVPNKSLNLSNDHKGLRVTGLVFGDKHRKKKRSAVEGKVLKLWGGVRCSYGVDQRPYSQ